MPSWICKGVARDGQQHPNQNPPGLHEPYENFGVDCVICGLKREQVEGGSSKIPAQVTIGAAILGAIFAFGFGTYKLLSSDQKTVVNPTPTASPTNTVETTPTPSSTNTVETTPTPSPTNTVETPQPSSFPLGYRTMAEVKNVPNINARYGGSTSFPALVSPKLRNKILSVHPSFALNYTEPPPGEKPGTGTGIRMLIDGQLSFSLASRPVKDKEFTRTEKRGFKLEQIPVGIDGIALYVKKDLSIPGLTLSQVKDIFTGKITNWSQVGGPDLEIKPVSRDPEDGGTPEYFKEKIMENKSFAKSVEPYVRDTTTSIVKVAGTPGNIGFATASEVCNQEMITSLSLAKSENQTPISPCDGEKVNLAKFRDETYPITRRIFVVVKKDDSIDEQAGIAFANMLLSDDGQQLMEEAGLVPLRTR